MRNSGTLFFSLVLSVMILFVSCNGFEQVKRNSDINYKLAMADKYYAKKDYLKARELYEGLMPVMKGTKNFEGMFYKYCMSLYNLKDYLSASYYFKNFTSSFPASKDADEASFLHAYCLYKLSPKATVEQTNTMKAMEALQTFQNTHPDNAHQEEVSKYISALRDKLEIKEANAAKLYFDIGKYLAATVAYKIIINDFPESKSMDEYQYMIVKSHYYFAKGSTQAKQEERFVNVLNAYQELVDTYPKSKYLQDAEKYFTLASNNLKKLKK